MSANDLHHCAQLLSQMLDKDTGSVNSKRGVLSKRTAAVDSKPFITTGRIVRKGVTTKSKPKIIKHSGKQKPSVNARKDNKVQDEGCKKLTSNCRSGKSSLNRELLVNQIEGIKHKADRFRNGADFSADYRHQINSVQKIITAPTSEKELGDNFHFDDNHMPPPSPVCFNQRLVSSTPCHTPTRRVRELGGALILDGSTGTQILNATDDVCLMHKTEKKSPAPRLIRANINVVSNPVQIDVSENQLDDPSSKRKTVENVDRSKHSVPTEITCSTFQYSGAKLFVSTDAYKERVHDTTALQSNRVDRKNSLLDDRNGLCLYNTEICQQNIGAGKSLDGIVAGNSAHCVDAGISALCRSVTFEHKLNRHDSSPQSPERLKSSFLYQKSGSLINLSSDAALQAGSMLKNVCHLAVGTSFRSDSSIESGCMEGISLEKTKCTRQDVSVDEKDIDNNYKRHVVDDSDTTRLMNLLKQVKYVVSNKHSSKICRLIAEIQDVVANTPNGQTSVTSQSNIDADLAQQPLRSENAQLRRRVRILNQQLREKGQHLEDKVKPDPSFEILHQTMLNQHLENEILELKETNEDLIQKNQRLQEDYNKVVQGKAEMLNVIAEKDCDYMKSLQDKMQEIFQTKSEMDILRTENNSNISQLKDQMERLEFKLKQKDIEIERIQTTNKSFQESFGQLINDILSSRPYPWMSSANTVDSNMKTAQELLSDNMKETYVEGKNPKDLTVYEKDSNLCEKQTTNSVEKKTYIPSDSRKAQVLNSGGLKAISNKFSISDERLNQVFSRIKEWQSQCTKYSRSCQQPPSRTVRDILNPSANHIEFGDYRVHFDNIENIFDIHQSIPNSKEDQDDTLIEDQAEEKVTELKTAGDRSCTDISRHSIADYFRKYDCKTKHSSLEQDEENSYDIQRCSLSSNVICAFGLPSFPANTEILSLHSSDFECLSSHQHSSEIESEGDMVESAGQEAKNSSDGSILFSETKSVGTALTFSSLDSISAVDDKEFQDSLKCLDENIAQIQENLYHDLSLRFSSLPAVSNS